LHPGQAFARRLFLPVWPRVGADDPATRADHPRPETCTGISSGHGAALMVERWWQYQHVTPSDRTPSARMSPSVIGSIGSLK
jgi:hypothetical protein